MSVHFHSYILLSCTVPDLGRGPALWWVLYVHHSWCRVDWNKMAGRSLIPFAIKEIRPSPLWICRPFQPVCPQLPSASHCLPFFPLFCKSNAVPCSPPPPEKGMEANGESWEEVETEENWKKEIVGKMFFCISVARVLEYFLFGVA